MSGLDESQFEQLEMKYVDFSSGNQNMWGPSFNAFSFNQVIPIFDVPLINLAIRPSNASIKLANKIAIIAIANFPSIANLIEVKPKKQCFPPKEPKRKTRKYKQQVLTYIINQAKFKAAGDFCNDRKMGFRILTEDHLVPKKGKK